MTKRYLEDFAVGQTFGSRTSAGRQGADQDIRRRIRSSAIPPRRGGRARHDLPGIGRERLAHGCADDAAAGRERDLNPAGGIVGAGVDELRWPLPVRPGDELRVESEVLEVRPSKSRPNQGLIKVRTTTLNQNGEAVPVFVANLIVPRRDR